MPTLAEAVALLNSLSPLAIIGLLTYIVYLLVAKKGPVKTLGNNHLHDLPVMSATLSRMENTLEQIRDGINYLKGRKG